MTTTARPIAPPTRTSLSHAPRSYAHAHWWFLAAFAVIVAGFWPTFFRPRGSGTLVKDVHGVTSSLWYLGLMAQSWLMSRGLVAWHRGVALGMIALLPVLSISALSNTSQMLTGSIIPPFARPVTAFADFQLVAQLLVFTGLGLLNRRTPPAHKRYMAATSLVGFPPALARLYGNLGIVVWGPIHTTLLTVDLVLVALILVDWRNGERTRRAYPLFLAWNIAFELLAEPVAATSGWLAFCRWFAAGA